MSRLSLRVKLVVTVLLLVGCALTIVGVAAVTAVRRYLTERVDAQVQPMADSFRSQLAEGRHQLSFNMPDTSPDSVNVPNPYRLKSLAPDGSLIDWYPKPLPADGPALDTGDLSRTEPFTTRSTVAGAGRWRVQVLTGPAGQHVVIAARMSDVDGVVGQLVLLVLLVGLGVLALATVGGIWLVRVSLRPLDEIERTTGLIAAGDLSRRAPQRDPRTEVGRLGQAFNVMIERIERAFAAQAASEATAHASEARARRSEDKMRQFVADASHELRTPLTTIRGFAELYRQGAAADPAGAARLIRRIEDEAKRMGLLVEDLLLLARLDQERPLAMEPVDLVVLVSDALDAAHALAPGRPVVLELRSRGPVVVAGDEDRLRQVITNLVGNALNHTPGDAQVALRLDRRPGQAVMEVADTGPGLTAEQTQRVFERFYRADPARSRRDGPNGAGLGLAIVAAIVAAHAGTVEVDSAAGEGATFRVILPVPADPA